MLPCPEARMPWHAGFGACPALTAVAPPCASPSAGLLQPPPSVNILCVPASGKPASWEEVTMQVKGESEVKLLASHYTAVRWELESPLLRGGIVT